MKFSILMSTYYKEKAEYFDRAMQSIWDEQTIKPDEIVLVQDGKLTEELYKTINLWSAKLGDVFKTIPLEKNVGLGDALNIGLQHCSNELIARMDTDDIAGSDRFEKQLEIFHNFDIDICGSWVSEFVNDENKFISYREVPENDIEIKKFAKIRNPINHPSVMFKKQAILDVGSYKKMMFFEDYYLWIHLILNKAKFYNIQKPLVNMRAGYEQLERRSGYNYAISEFEFHQELLKLKFLNKREFLKSVLIKFLIRVAPKNIVKYIYKILREKKK